MSPPLGLKRGGKRFWKSEPGMEKLCGKGPLTRAETLAQGGSRLVGRGVNTRKDSPPAPSHLPVPPVGWAGGHSCGHTQVRLRAGGRVGGCATSTFIFWKGAEPALQPSLPAPGQALNPSPATFPWGGSQRGPEGLMHKPGVHHCPGCWHSRQLNPKHVRSHPQLAPTWF